MRQEFSGHNIYDMSWTRRVLEQLPDQSSLDGGIWTTFETSVKTIFDLATVGTLEHGFSRDETDWFKVSNRPEVEEKFKMDEDDNFILDRYGDKIPVYQVLWVSLSSELGAFFIVHDSDGNGGGVGQAVIGGNDRCVIEPFSNHKITGEMFIEVRSAADSSNDNNYRLKVTTTQPTHC